MRHTSRFTFSICLVLWSVFAEAQVSDTIKAADTIPVKTERYGVRFGVDLFKIIKSAFDPDYKGLELVGDYRLTKKFYLAAEIGNENKTTDDERLDFTTKGSYFKVGFDYNTYENWLDMENMVYIGLRYGVASFSQELNSYRIYNSTDYFNEQAEQSPAQEFNGLTASWAEVVVGVKAELFPNFYAGFSFRLSKLITQKEPQNFENLYIPGFNRTYGGDIGVGFNYTVSYFIPIYKKNLAPKEKKKG
jgi:hypothetical protein